MYLHFLPSWAAHVLNFAITGCALRCWSNTFCLLQITILKHTPWCTDSRLASMLLQDALFWLQNERQNLERNSLKLTQQPTHSFACCQKASALPRLPAQNRRRTQPMRSEVHCDSMFPSSARVIPTVTMPEYAPFQPQHQSTFADQSPIHSIPQTMS